MVLEQRTVNRPRRPRMDHLKAMSRSSHLIAWGGLLLFIFLFFDWQQVSTPLGSAGRSGWHGWGVLVGLLTIALVVWEATQIFAVKLDLPFKGALLTAGLDRADPRDRDRGRRLSQVCGRRADRGQPDQGAARVAAAGRAAGRVAGGLSSTDRGACRAPRSVSGRRAGRSRPRRSRSRARGRSAAGNSSAGGHRRRRPGSGRS